FENRRSMMSGDKDLEPVLASVSSAGDQAGIATDIVALRVEAPYLADLKRRHFGQNRHRFRSLDCNKTELITLINPFSARTALLKQPLRITRDIGRVDAQHVAVRFEPVQNQVIEGASIVSAHQRVLSLAVLQTARRIG